MTVDELRRRCGPIRLSVVELAGLAGVNPATVHRALSGSTSPIHATFERLEQALLDEEARLFAHLVALQPKPRTAA